MPRSQANAVLCNKEIYRATQAARLPVAYLLTRPASWDSSGCLSWGSPHGRSPVVVLVLRLASWGFASCPLRCLGARFPGHSHFPGVRWVLQTSLGMGCAGRWSLVLAGHRLLDSTCLRPQAPCFSSRAADPAPPLDVRQASHLACCSTTARDFLVSCLSCAASLDSIRNVCF
jgi:hypothetical protein